MRARLAPLFVAVVVLVAVVAATAPRAAQTDVRFVLDFLLQGQQSAFVLGREKGYSVAAAQRAGVGYIVAGDLAPDRSAQLAAMVYDDR